MADPRRTLCTSDFDYHLPPELIAQHPSARRGESRLLVVPAAHEATALFSGAKTASPDPIPHFEHRNFSDLATLIPAGDLLVLNTSKVRRARLLGRRPSGAPVEILLLHPAVEDAWVVMGAPGSALQPGTRITLGDGLAVETLEILDEGYRLVRFVGGTAADAMARYGHLPLPPYITRNPTPEDDERYQTVFAEREGSVAAPTAGLHFTAELLHALESNGVRMARIELEVGPGTFRPVQTEVIGEHAMHPERYEISPAAAEAIERTRADGGRVWAVGTTVVRALESAVGANGKVKPGASQTRLMIAPGFDIHVVDRLITNFHLPRSTLLMLVAAFAGLEQTLTAYRAAVEARYRFYSYGDAMVVL